MTWYIDPSPFPLVFSRSKNLPAEVCEQSTQRAKIKTQYPNPKFQIITKHQDEMTKLASLGLGFGSFGAYWVPRFAGLVLGIWNFNFLRALRLNSFLPARRIKRIL
jgi:hypothetical protein